MTCAAAVSHVEEARQRCLSCLTREWRRLKADVLTDREALVLGLRLGVSGLPLTQDRVARRLGLAVGSIPAIERRALRKACEAIGARQECAS